MIDLDSENSAHQTKAYLKSAREQMIDTGRDLRQFSEFVVHKFGDAAVPQLRRFLNDVREGRITIDGLTDSARDALLGYRGTPQEREAMIREAAYFRAEWRGFTDGYAETDWYAAEREVDARLANETGLLHKWYQTLSSAASVAEKQLGRVKHAFTEWIEGASSANRPDRRL